MLEFIKNNSKSTRQDGYIAVVTALIFTAVVLTAVFSVATSGLISRTGKVQFANKGASYAAARACIDRARLQLFQSPAYTGNETINIYDYQCSILAIEISGNNKIIKTMSSVLGATSNLKLTVDNNLATVSFEEVVSH